jgi:hypothetical protein
LFAKTQKKGWKTEKKDEKKDKIREEDKGEE